MYEWSENAFAEAVRSTAAELDDIGISTSRYCYPHSADYIDTLLKSSSILFIPISGLLGDNLIEPSSRLSWYNREEGESLTKTGSGDTMLAAIDKVLE